ncbi:MAG TPA: S-layer homology domain-containing protein [Vicinamibacteria bacterium]|nr:S-layer homology domain-containing protein [Vicinamibacteria bacterium]
MATAPAFAQEAPPAHHDPECAAPAVSVLPAPDWYAERCLGGAAAADDSQYAESPPLDPGDVAFFKNHMPPPQNIKTAPMGSLNFTIVGPNDRPLFAMAFNPTATTLYAVDNTSRELGTINQTTGVFTPIAALNPNPAGTVTGLAFDPTGTAAYFTATTGAVATLYTVDVATAALTPVGPITGFPFTIDIAIDRTGQVYGHDIALDALIRIDKATGAGTMIGPTGMQANFAQGMMYDSSQDLLLACMFVTAPVAQGLLCRFNTGTGTCTVTGGPVPDELECAARVAAVRLAATALTVDSAGNRVMDPAETVVVAPSWRNDASVAQNNVTGTFSGFAGPAGGTYTINDATAAYGSIAAGATATCGNDCYGVTASAGTRPLQHWDTTVLETLSAGGVRKTWALHVGGSFADVPASSAYYRFIETLLHKGVTGGCSASNYCPANPTTREQMAVFVLAAREGAGYMPPACVPPNLFSDVPESSPFCRFVEELASRQVVTGCGPGLYCPASAVTREQMAVFALRTLDPALSPPPCVQGSEMFDDVPFDNPFCRWIEELARRGVVSGCGGGNYCPTAPVTREQMGVFLSATFGLTLYGV